MTTRHERRDRENLGQRGFYFIVLNWDCFEDFCKEGTLKIEYIEYFFASFCTEGLINSDHISSFYDILKKPGIMAVKIGTARPEANV